MSGSTSSPWGPDDFRFFHQPLLGTFVEVRLPSAVGAERAEQVDRAVIDEMSRLQAVFSAYDPDSELARWQRLEVEWPSEEFSAAMRLALTWQQRSDGRFNTASGVLTEMWRSAQSDGNVPTAADLAAVAVSIREPRFAVDPDGRAHPVGDCSGVNLNAFAKGWIVDRAGARARELVPDSDVLVNAGGDLRHAGGSPIRIGIENPLRPYDNESPLAIVRICGSGLATSGRARQGFRVNGRWYSHVIDPRTGQTVDNYASISVVAHDAATADVLATVLGLLEPADAVRYADEEGAACLLIAPDGAQTRNERWVALEETGRA
jgi:thiamine biosynthesis lipoprotein